MFRWTGISSGCPAGRRATGAWRTHTYIYVGVARMVREFYKIHEQATGSNVRTAYRARAAGHQPPAAWDDPGTLAWPLGWTEPIIAATPEGVAVDDVVVARVLALVEDARRRL